MPNLDISLKQARYIMEALGEANFKHLMEVEDGKHSTEEDGESSSKFNNILRMKTLRSIIEFLDEHTPAGLTIDEGSPQAYPGQKFSGMFGPLRRSPPTKNVR